MRRSILILFLAMNQSAYALPSQFVYLHDVDPTILQEIRYAGYHNVIGRPIAGYRKNVCILTRQVAEALAQVQRALRPMHLSLKVYDCYRPIMAVHDFITWSEDPNHQEMKTEFYPREDKAELFALGYFAVRSAHSRGSAVDLTLVPLPIRKEAPYSGGMSLTACYAPYEQRFQDNSVNMGTGYDCLDKAAFWQSGQLPQEVHRNRQLLRVTMKKQGFLPYDKEWWHFNLLDEPYPQQYFNFPVR